MLGFRRKRTNLHEKYDYPNARHAAMPEATSRGRCAAFSVASSVGPGLSMVFINSHSSAAECNPSLVRSV